MMPPSLLDELEQTAKVAGVRVALCAAYLSGQVCELKASVDSLRKLREPDILDTGIPNHRFASKLSASEQDHYLATLEAN